VIIENWCWMQNAEGLWAIQFAILSFSWNESMRRHWLRYLGSESVFAR
jgi:hypothetical protein